MTVTIEVINKETFNLLQNMENKGLIHIKTGASCAPEKTPSGDTYAYRKLRGVHKNLPGASVDEFLAGCHADKKRELAAEKRHA